jgi:potassium efflux system protein
MPAFTRLRDIALWTYMGMEGGEEKLKNFSLASVAFILATITLATIAVRNLPALIEILLLDRFDVSPGARYAIKTLTAYALIAIAAMIVSDALGISWGRVQWLVAALGVGIGFGLQEIVANFISGLIILFERPVRVGDVVTIGDTTGTVTKIRIRATTVRNWDRQELLVPNKQFITGQLLNWTLSDALNRIVIRVGVDYERRRGPGHAPHGGGGGGRPQGPEGTGAHLHLRKLWRQRPAAPGPLLRPRYRRSRCRSPQNSSRPSCVNSASTPSPSPSPNATST